MIIKNNLPPKKIHTKIFFILRCLTLLFLIFLIARPQWVDRRSRVNVNGVDIALTLDVSGSMRVFDSLQDKRSRIDVAKQEAARFIKKRIDDPIAIVIFGADAVCICPLTLDKTILQSIIRKIKLGTINPRGTSLATGLATAVNKLKHSKAKSKIIILLTDGKPTPETEKVTVETALTIAKKLKVKIYTVAIGNKQGGYVTSAFGMVQQIQDSVNEDLLKTIARQTGGEFFRANNPQEMKKIYEKINRLEKTTYETNLFSRYYEAFYLFIWIIIFLIFSELILKLFVWRGIL
jgi:Ca-activated chloride channel family protein